MHHFRNRGSRKHNQSNRYPVEVLEVRRLLSAGTEVADDPLVLDGGMTGVTDSAGDADSEPADTATQDSANKRIETTALQTKEIKAETAMPILTNNGLNAAQKRTELLDEIIRAFDPDGEFGTSVMDPGNVPANLPDKGLLLRGLTQGQVNNLVTGATQPTGGIGGTSGWIIGWKIDGKTVGENYDFSHTTVKFMAWYVVADPDDTPFRIMYDNTNNIPAWIPGPTVRRHEIMHTDGVKGQIVRDLQEAGVEFSPTGEDGKLPIKGGFKYGFLQQRNKMNDEIDELVFEPTNDTPSLTDEIVTEEARKLVREFFVSAAEEITDHGKWHGGVVTIDGHKYLKFRGVQ